MFQVFRYIIFFLVGYKIIKLIFGNNARQKSVEPPSKRQSINTVNQQQYSNAKPASNFDDAEFIEYEEVK
jgi:hypothetical protein